MPPLRRLWPRDASVQDVCGTTTPQQDHATGHDHSTPEALPPGGRAVFRARAFCFSDPPYLEVLDDLSVVHCYSHESRVCVIRRYSAHDK